MSKDLEYYRKNAEEVIEGVLKVLSHFEYLPNQYKHCLPAIEKAQKFLGKQYD